MRKAPILGIIGFIELQESFGYKTLAQFVRDLMLKEDLATYKMLQEIHKKVCL